MVVVVAVVTGTLVVAVAVVAIVVVAIVVVVVLVVRGTIVAAAAEPVLGATTGLGAGVDGAWLPPTSTLFNTPRLVVRPDKRSITRSDVSPGRPNVTVKRSRPERGAVEAAKTAAPSTNSTSAPRTNPLTDTVIGTPGLAVAGALIRNWRPPLVAAPGRMKVNSGASTTNKPINALNSTRFDRFPTMDHQYI